MKFRKKPVVIEAFQLTAPTDHTTQAPPHWFIEGLISGKLSVNSDESVTIETLEGSMVANVGDWIIQGVKGELYPCKPDIFALTYEAI